MDYEAYRKAFFTDPEPEAYHKIQGVFGFTLFYEDYEEAMAFFSAVFGPPGYVEGEYTRGWRVGDFWLTLLKAHDGSPKNAEMALTMSSDDQASKLQQAFVEAGGTAEDPSEVLMYEPVKIFPVTDPFGTAIMLVVRL